MRGTVVVALIMRMSVVLAVCCQTVDKKPTLDQFYRVGFTRQKKPTGLRAVALSKFSKHLGRIVFGINRDRVHKDVTTDPVAQQPLNLR